MNKIICKRVRYCYPYEVEYIYNKHITLKAGYVMNDLRSEISPEYSFKSSDKEPGRLVEQTLNIRFREDYDLEAVSSPIILLLETDFGEIVMGSQSYPCSVEISSDGLSKKLTFKAENIG